MLCSLAAAARDGEIVPERETVIAQAQTPPAGTQQPGQAAPATRHPPDGRAPGVIELMNQVEDLQAEINRLRGQLEVLSNGLENSQKRQRDMYLDLDTRVRRIEQTAGGAPPRAETTPAQANDPEARAKPPGSPDLDARVKRVEQGTNPAPATPAPAGNPPPATTQAVPT